MPKERQTKAAGTAGTEEKRTLEKDRPPGSKKDTSKRTEKESEKKQISDQSVPEKEADIIISPFIQDGKRVHFGLCRTASWLVWAAEEKKRQL